MSVVTKHNSKEKGERHNCERSRVGFLVVGNTVSIDNLLEEESHVVALDVGRRVQLRDALAFFELLEGSSSERGELVLDISLISRW